MRGVGPSTRGQGVAIRRRSPIARPGSARSRSFCGVGGPTNERDPDPGRKRRSGCPAGSFSEPCNRGAVFEDSGRSRWVALEKLREIRMVEALGAGASRSWRIRGMQKRPGPGRPRGVLDPDRAVAAVVDYGRAVRAADAGMSEEDVSVTLRSHAQVIGVAADDLEDIEVDAVAACSTGRRCRRLRTCRCRRSRAAATLACVNTSRVYAIVARAQQCRGWRLRVRGSSDPVAANLGTGCRASGAGREGPAFGAPSRAPRPGGEGVQDVALLSAARSAGAGLPAVREKIRERRRAGLMPRGEYQNPNAAGPLRGPRSDGPRADSWVEAPGTRRPRSSRGKKGCAAGKRAWIGDMLPRSIFLDARRLFR